MIKVLLINHHFDQDIDALTSNADEEIEFKVISAWIFLALAQKYFPPSVFCADLSEFYKEEYSDKRNEWAACAKRTLQKLFIAYHFDIIVSPSDTFFYLRDVIRAAGEIGVPVIVLQKESYLSPQAIYKHSMGVKKYFPFMSDHMAICSEMSRKFWEMAGTPSDKISVIGQPRFDFYRQPERWKKLENLGIKFEKKLPVLLFFSYDLGDYFEESMITGVKPWLQLREETEEILFDYVRRGAINLIIKPHPQQRPEDINYVKGRLSNFCGKFIGRSVVTLEGPFDARQLIINSDYVVGFQTTALLESLAVGKKVIYTFWTEKVNEVKPKLLPYHQYPEFIDCAKSKESLREIIDGYLKGGVSTLSQKNQAMNKLIEDYEGVMDGHATDRFLVILERFVQKSKRAQLSDPVMSGKINKLKSLRIVFLLRYLVITCVEATVIMTAYITAYPFTVMLRIRRDIAEKLKSQLSGRIMTIKECVEALSGKNIIPRDCWKI